jgi:hypothetical protein
MEYFNLTDVLKNQNVNASSKKILLPHNVLQDRILSLFMLPFQHIII